MPLHSRAIPLQFPEQPSDLRARFEQLVDGSLIGLAGASSVGLLAEDGGLADLRLQNWVAFAVNGARQERQDG